MALIYVTGIETAGKSAVCNELQNRGFEAYDIDDGIAHYYNKVTGSQSDGVDSATKRTEEWYEQHEYVMNRAQVEQFRQRAQSKPIFVCGTTRNDGVVLDLFDHLVYLSLDETALKQRLSTRQPFEFGSTPYEREKILSWHKSSEEAYRELGATMIDATLPIEDVVDKIILKVIN